MAIATDHPMTAADLLEHSPFLRLLPPDARREVASRFVAESFRFGQVIVREGEPSDAYYLLTAGRVRVLKSGRDGQEISLHTLQAGDSFGEIGLLNGGVRTATVRASGDVAVLRLNRQHFNDILDHHPELRTFLGLQLQHRTLFAFFKELTSFEQAPVAALQEILGALRPVNFRRGETILRQGDPGGPMFFIEQGQVCIHRTRQGKRRNLAFLRPGDYFGELSFLERAPRHATAEAHTDCRLLALDPEPFARILASFPALRQVVDRRISRYNEKQEAPMPLDFIEAAAEAPDATRRHMHTLTAQRPILPSESASQSGASPAAPGRRQRHPRLEFVPQVDESDCGAAALGMVCRHFGRQVSLAYIRELSNTAVSGTGLNDLCRAANELGLTAQAVKKAPHKVDDLPLPSILHWQNNHWVVLLQVTAKRVRLADPATGIRWVTRAELTANWSGYAATFGYTEAFAAAPERRGLATWLLPFLRPALPGLLRVVLLTLLICGLQLAIPKLTQITVDDVIGARDVQALNLIVIALGAALVGTLLLTVLQRWLLGHTAARLDGRLLEDITAKLLSLPMRYFHNRRHADIQRRLESVRAARYFLVHDAVSGLLAVVQIVSFLALMMLFNVTMTLLFFGIMAPLYLGILYFSGKVLRPAFHDLQSSELRFQQLQSEVIKGIEIVKASGTEKKFHQRTLDDFRQLIRTQSSSKFNIFCYEGTVQAIWFMSLILFIWLGARLAMAGELSIGSFIAFQMLLAMIYSPVQTIVNLWESLQSSSGFIDTLRDIIEATPEQGPDTSTLKPVPSLAGRIAVRDLCFTYGGPESPQILSQVAFSVQPGQKVAIVGRSGSGKTTLIKCLAALMTPDRGTILYDGIDAANLRHSDLRRHVGLVLQENYFFSGTIADNIAFGDDQPDLDRATWAARVAAAHDFITQLPDGYQTLLGEDSGTMLSHGQRQSLAIARAIYRDPVLLFLDEATNSLDIETERAIYEQLSQIFAKRTMFLVTHRLNMIADADLILVLDRGTIIEQGKHHDLLNRRGLYYHLIRRQVE